MNVRLSDGPAARTVPPDAPPSPRTPPADASPNGRRHIPALDGLRAFAVLAVLCYHAGVSWLPGGLLGVDLFFVLSGFLITGLLLDEHRRTGHIALATFWTRRARRLLPALLLVLLAVAAYARYIADPTQATSLRSDAIATLCYVANWRFALSHQGYFDQFAPPSPLRHTWSLAVEEQYYLLWPLIVAGLLTWGTRHSRRKRRAMPPPHVLVGTAAAVGAAASATAALVLSLRHADPSRIYYGTDTRSQALFVGAALAAAFAGGMAPATTAARRAWTATGLLAAAAVVAVWLTVNGDSPRLDRGGFGLFALAVAALVAAVAGVPGSHLAKALSLRPLRYLGRISYGIYLWHWPLFLTLTAARTHLGGIELLAARFAATFALAAASFHLVERPVRAGTRAHRHPARSAVTALTLVLAVMVVATGRDHPASAAGTPIAALSAPKGMPTTGGVPASSGASAAGGMPTAVSKQAAARPVRVLLEGDSVALTFGSNIPPATARSMGVDLVDKGIDGCGIVALPGRTQGVTGVPPPVCQRWAQTYRQDVVATRPAVAALLVGRWEVTDRKLDGRWTAVGEPGYDAYLARQLDIAIDALSSGGAKVALLTTPVFEPREAPDGSQFPETDASRVVAFNRLLAAAAARHPGVARVVDFGHVLTPDDRYQAKVDGVVVRWSDGVHIAAAGSALAARAIFPDLISMSRPDTAAPSAPPTTRRG